MERRHITHSTQVCLMERRQSSRSMLVPYALRQRAVVPASASSRVLRGYESRRGYRYRRMMVSGGKLLSVDNEGCKNHLAVVREAPNIIPDGWIVEEVRRKYMKSTDKYYCEPETGLKFRSLIAIQRYLAELDEDAPLSRTLEEIMENKPLARAFKLENHKSSTRGKKDTSCKASSFIEPPLKVTWVLASAQGDSWNPFISNSLVPEAVKQQWTNRFMLFMKDGTTNFHNFQV